MKVIKKCLEDNFYLCTNNSQVTKFIYFISILFLLFKHIISSLNDVVINLMSFKIIFVHCETISSSRPDHN